MRFNWHRFKPTPQTFNKIIKYFLIIVACIIALGTGVFLAYSRDLPDPNKINTREVAQSTKIYDRNGVLLYEIHGEVKRTVVPFDQIPDNVKHATIAIEDKEFYKHGGVDLRGILRAALRDATTGSLSQGGSSITQQLVKNALLSREKSITRKVKELVLSIQIEQRISKDDILKLYLNEIPYGQNAYGVEAAAQTYFAKDAQNLDLAEAAYLAAMEQRPSYFNPFGKHRAELDSRKNLVLQKMLEQGYINQDQYNSAKSEQVAFKSAGTGILAPHFVMYVQDLLQQQYGDQALQESGFKVTTTLDYSLQKMAEQAVTDHVDKNLSKYNAGNAGMVAIDPKTGEILAMVGSKDFFDDTTQGQVNIATSPRQPGSSFKPYVYATAFAQGYAPSSMLLDVKTVFGTYGGQPYSPNNYTGQEYGPLPMRKTLDGSLNISAVKTLSLVGVKDAINTAKAMGISSDLSVDKCGLSLVLGGCEVELLDHTAAFGVFANGGVKHSIKAIMKIEDSSGHEIFKEEPDQGDQVITPEVAYQIDNVLSDNDARTYVFGASNYLTLPNRPVAAKTGTTNNNKDAWTVGFTPQLAAGVWVGNMDGTKMKAGADGSIVAAPIWNQFMKAALADKPAEQFSKPDDMVDMQVDSVSGLLPTSATPNVVTATFAPNEVPTQYDNVHQLVKVNKSNGLLATSDTPADQIEVRAYTVFHSEKPDDPDWENPVRAWAAAHGYTYPPTQKDGSGDVLPTPTQPLNPTTNSSTTNTTQKTGFAIISPQNGANLTHQTPIQVQLTADQKPSDVVIYVQSSLGNTASLTGTFKPTNSNNTIYQFSWAPTENLKGGIYTLYAKDANGNHTDGLTVYSQ